MLGKNRCTIGRCRRFRIINQPEDTDGRSGVVHSCRITDVRFDHICTVSFPLLG